MKQFFYSAVIIFVAVLFPDIAVAQIGADGTLAPNSGFVPCEGSGCNACHFVVMANTIIRWMMGIIAVLFAVVAAMAGWGLVTSAGNAGAVEDAKKKFVSTFIGFVIVLGAWLLIDTIMLALTGEESGSWADVECTPQTATVLVENEIGDSDSSNTSDTFDGTALTEEQLAALGDGEEGIVAFAELMDSLNCSYSQPLRNACQGNPAYTDCSDLVNNAYQAAGCESPGTYTGNMIDSATTFTSNTELRAGDALIRRSNGSGHVVICMDNGCSQVIHAEGTATGIVVSNGSNYYDDPRYTSAVRAADYCP